MSRAERLVPIGSVTVRRTGQRAAVVTVAGEHDQSNIADVLSALLGAAASAEDVVVDLGATTFISAAFIGAIAVASAGQQRRGGQLRVQGASPFVRRLFGLCDLAGVLQPTGAPVLAAQVSASRQCALVGR